MMKLLRRRDLTLGLAAAVLYARPAMANGLVAPAGKVILTISGMIKTSNTVGAARFDRDMLEALGMEKFTTTTPWFGSAVTFEGVPLNRLMTTVGATSIPMTASPNSSTRNTTAARPGS